MTETQEVAEITTITKSDQRGRARYGPEYNEKVLDAFEASAMSGPEFARHCGVKYPTFAGWAARRRKERVGGEGAAGAGGSPANFVIAEFADSPGQPPAGALRVLLPGGASAEITDASGAELLAALLRSLA